MCLDDFAFNFAAHELCARSRCRPRLEVAFVLRRCYMLLQRCCAVGLYGAPGSLRLEVRGPQESLLEPPLFFRLDARRFALVRANGIFAVPELGLGFGFPEACVADLCLRVLRPLLAQLERGVQDLSSHAAYYRTNRRRDLYHRDILQDFARENLAQRGSRPYSSGP